MKLDELNKLKENYEKTLREKGQEIMGEAVTEFFEKNPLIKAVTWTQYTPHFNDGDECVFGVGEPSFSFEPVNVVPARVYEDSEEGPFFTTWATEEYTEAELTEYRGSNFRRDHNAKVVKLREEYGAEKLAAIGPAEKSFSETVGLAPEELFRAAFGDHVTVLLTRTGAKTEHYEHD
jgi:hypothetical protein